MEENEEFELALLEKAISIAEEVHKNETTYRGEPLMMHPLAIMEQMETTKGKIKAVLHDTVEDGGVTLEFLKNEGFGEDIINSLDTLSRRQWENGKEPYEDYIDRICSSNDRDALEIKFKDLLHNSSVERMMYTSDDKKAKVLNRMKTNYIPALEKIDMAMKELDRKKIIEQEYLMAM